MSNNSYYNDAWRIINEKNQSLVSNYSMEFDGTNDFINCGNFAPFNVQHTKFSISLWCKSPNSFTDSGSLIESRLSYPTPNGIAIDFIDGSMSFRQTGSTFTKTIAEWGLNNTNWNHIVFAYDLTIQSVGSNNIFVYINNAPPPNRSSATLSQPATTADFKIGDGLRGNFNGQIDQVSIFNYTLSAGQVSTLYGGGTAVGNPMSLSPKPQAYYQLGDQSASNNTTEPTPPVQSYLVPNNSLQDYVFNFNGTSNKIELRNSSSTDTSLNLTPNASISAWIYKTSVNSFGVIYANSRGNSGYFGFSLLVNNSNKLELRCNLVNQIGISSATVPHDEWVHVAATYKSGSSGTSEIKLSINGVIETNPSLGNLPPLNYTNPAVSSGVEIGDGLSLFPFVGEISNVSLFDSVLTSAQITTIYNNGTPSDISSLSPVSWWKLNAEDVFVYPNWVIRDSAGTNNGASVGMTSANLVQSTLQLGVGFSPYALELDGTSQYFNCGTELANSLGNGVTNFSFSGWYTAQSSANNEGLFGIGDGTTDIVSLTQVNFNTRVVTIGSTTSRFIYDSRDQWANFIVVVSGDGNSPLTLKYYHDGVELISLDSPSFPNSLDFSGKNAYIGNNTNLLRFFKGEISNFSFFNFALTSAQVTELNNNQRTSNLNNLSFAKPLAWWELGSNSGFNSSTWTALNEGTVVGGNAVSTANMAEDDIVNGVGYTGNGLGTSSIEIVGDAPYSPANGISVNIDALDRTTDVPS